MFYSQDILQKRGGKFGKIWLAATRMSKLTRREIASICISKSCDEIMDYVEKRVPPSQPGGKRPRFSLYLSAQLMFGLARIFEKQSFYLLSDASSIFIRVKMMPAQDIDLLVAPRIDLVTQPEITEEVSMVIDTTLDVCADPNLSDGSVKKRFWGMSSSSDRSSTTGSRRSRGTERSSDSEAALQTASIEQITLVEPPPVLVNTPLSPIPVPRELDLPLLNGQELDMLLETVPEPRLNVEDLLPTSTPMFSRQDEQTRPTVESSILEEPKEKTPSKSTRTSHAPRTRAVPQSPGVTQQILSSPPTRRPRPSLQLELTPLTPSPYRRRQRKQLVFADKNTQIPKTVMKQNLLTTTDIRRDLGLQHPRAEGPDALFKRPSRKGVRPEIATGIWAGTAIFRAHIPEEQLPASSPSTSEEEERHAAEEPVLLVDQSTEREPSLMDLDMLQMDANITIPDVSVPADLQAAHVAEPVSEFRMPSPTPLVTPSEVRRRRGRKRTLEESMEQLRKTGSASELYGSHMDTPSMELQRDASISGLSGSLNLDKNLTLDDSRKSKADSSTSKKKQRLSQSLGSELGLNMTESLAPSHTPSRSTLLYDVPEESIIIDQPQLNITPVDLESEPEFFLEKIADTLASEGRQTTTFRSVCPPEHTNKRTAAHCFTALLGLAASHKIKVKQMVPFEDIYIRLQE